MTLKFPHFLLILILMLLFSINSIAQNTALSFDGTNDYVETTYPGVGGATARTVEAWIKTSATTVGNQNVITDWGDMALGHRFTFCVLQNNSIRIEIGGGGIVGTTAVNDGIWHHVAAVYNPTATNKYILYIDGVLETSGNISTTINTSAVNNLRIGQRIDGVNEFEGDIDEVRVYDYARTVTEISSEYNSEYCIIPSGLKAYYRLNDGVANATNTGINTAIDDSGNSNNGTLNNFSLSGTSSNWVTGPIIAGGGSDSTLVINTCSSYTSNSGTTYSSSGVYTEMFTDTAGCDSTLTINLNISLPSANLSITACDSYTSPSGNYTWTGDGYYSDTLTVAGGCDSVYNITLDIANFDSTASISSCGPYSTPDGNNTWTTSGQYPITYTGSFSCDSIIIYDLTISSSTSSTIDVTKCGTYTSPSGNYIWTNSGTYLDTIQNSNGCDSTITIDLTIVNIDNGVTQMGSTLTSDEAGATYQWYSCTNGNIDSPVAGETGQSFTPTSSGDYAVEVSVNNCSEISACFTVDLSGIAASVIGSAKIYPNPSNGNFSITLPVVENNVAVTLINLQGKTITKKALVNTNKILINENLPVGIYFVQLAADNKIATYKIVIM